MVTSVVTTVRSFFSKVNQGNQLTMVYFVNIFGPSEKVQRAAERVRALASESFKLSSQTWLIESQFSAADLRDFIHEGSGVKVLVARLQRGWASYDLPKTAKWLKGVRNGF